MKKSMTEGRPLRLILTFAFPMLMGNLFQQTYNMMDAAIVGRTLGSDSLAAVGASSSVQFLVLGFCLGLCAGFAVPVAQRYGAKDYPTMRKYVFNAMFWTAVLAVVMTLMTVVLCSQILRMLQVPNLIFADARNYLLVIFLGIPFTLLYNLLSGILRSIGDSKTPFLFLAFSAVLNIALDFFCILVLHWGVTGAAAATVFSQAVSGILCLILIIRKFDVLRPQKEDMVISSEISGRLMRMGIPMGLNWSVTAIGSMVMQAANNGLGTVYVSGFTAGMKIKQFMMCPFDALATAVSTFAAQNYGARQPERIKKGIFQGAVVGVLYGIIAGGILIVFGRNLAMLFVSSDAAEVLDAAYKYLFRMGLFWWTLGILNVCRVSIQGLGYASRAMVAGAVEMIGRVVVSVFFVPLYGYDAITFADQTAWSLGMIYVLIVCIRTVRQVTERMKYENAV